MQTLVCTLCLITVPAIPLMMKELIKTNGIWRKVIDASLMLVLVAIFFLVALTY